MLPEPIQADVPAIGICFPYGPEIRSVGRSTSCKALVVGPGCYPDQMRPIFDLDPLRLLLTVRLLLDTCLLEQALEQASTQLRDRTEWVRVPLGLLHRILEAG